MIVTSCLTTVSPGSVIVDLAGESGGNCELSEAGQTVIEGGVKIIAPLNLPSELAAHASQLYARNVENLLELLVSNGELSLDFGDEIISGACVTHQGEIRHEGAREAAGATA